ncbi:MAG: hypothetical protein ACI9MS_003062 [Glaciecola sp.]|jgi:hypothetical protein
MKLLHFLPLFFLSNIAQANIIAIDRSSNSTFKIHSSIYNIFEPDTSISFNNGSATNPLYTPEGAATNPLYIPQSTNPLYTPEGAATNPLYIPQSTNPLYTPEGAATNPLYIPQSTNPLYTPEGAATNPLYEVDVTKSLLQFNQGSEYQVSFDFTDDLFELDITNSSTILIVFNDLALVGRTALDAQFYFGGRIDDTDNLQKINNLNIKTQSVSSPAILSLFAFGIAGLFIGVKGSPVKSEKTK